MPVTQNCCMTKPTRLKCDDFTHPPGKRCLKKKPCSVHSSFILVCFTLQITMNSLARVGAKCLVGARGHGSSWPDWLETNGGQRELDYLPAATAVCRVSSVCDVTAAPAPKQQSGSVTALGLLPSVVFSRTVLRAACSNGAQLKGQLDDWDCAISVTVHPPDALQGSCSCVPRADSCLISCRCPVRLSFLNPCHLCLP